MDTRPPQSRSKSMRRTSRSTSDVDVVVSAGSAWGGGDGDILPDTGVSSAVHFLQIDKDTAVNGLVWAGEYRGRTMPGAR
jgi:hypothetical protein